MNMIRLPSKEGAEWEVWVNAWSEASGQLRCYSTFGKGHLRTDLRVLKPFLKVPNASKVISTGASYFGKMS